MTKRLIAAAAVAGLAALALPLMPAAGLPVAEAAAPCTISVTLKPGAHGTAVRCVERRLAALGYAVHTPDTVYDATSVVAVKRFQLSRGLYADGIITSLTGRQLGVRGAMAPAGSPRVTVIGDSTSAAMRWYDEANNSTAIYDIMGKSYDLKWSVESCRRLVAASCVGRLDPGQGIRWQPVSVLPLMQSTLRGRLGDALVIMAGYDDSPRLTSAIDKIVTEAEQQGVTRVFWLTYRTTSFYKFGSFYYSHNADLRAARTRHPNLVVLDWNAYSHSQSAATQVAWFERDGVHMTRSGGTALAQFIKRAVDTSDVAACQASHATVGTAAGATGSPAIDSTGVGFEAVTARRVYDSRSATLGGGVGRVGANRKVAIDLSAALPADATSAVVNVTAGRPCAGGTLTVYSCGTRPTTAQVAFESGRTTTGTAIVPLTGRSLCVHTSAATELQVDVVGAFGPSGTLFHPRTPVRMADTRGFAAQVAVKGPIASGKGVTISVALHGGVPVGATAAWLNVTGVAPVLGGALTVQPGACGSTTARTVTVSVPRGRAAASMAIVPLSGGAVCVRAVGGPLHAVIDLAGWFGGSATGGLAFQPLPPTRVVGVTAPAFITSTSVVGGNAGAQPVLNVTTSRSTAAAYISASACGTTTGSSWLNTAWSETTSNVGTVAVKAGTKVCFRASAAMQFTVDRIGRFVVPPPV